MITLEWDEIEGIAVLVYGFQQGWSWRDFDNVKQRADTLLATSSIKIPLIFDLRAAPDMPPGMIKATQQVAETRHPNGSPVIIVGASNIVRTTFAIVRRMIVAVSANLLDDVIPVKTWDEINYHLKHQKTP